MKLEQRSCEVRANAPRTISGTIRYGVRSEDLGGFFEVIERGAFSDCLKDNPEVLCLWCHDNTKVLGSTQSGTLELKDTPGGLQWSCSAPNTSWGQDAVESIRRKDVHACSFGFNVQKDKFETKDGINLRHVTKAALREISPTSWAAYPENFMSVRSKNMNIQQLITERERVLTEMRNISDQELSTTPGKERHERLDSEFEKLDCQIRTEQRGEMSVQNRPHRPDPEDAQGASYSFERGEKRGISFFNRNAIVPRMSRGDAEDFGDFLVRGLRDIPYETRQRLERRALQSQSDVAGGFVIAPEQFTAELIRDLSDLVFVRKHARIISMQNSMSLTAPELANEVGSPDWTAELATGENDETMSFSKRALYPHPLARSIKCSKTLLRRMQAVEGWIRESMSTQFATVEEHAFLNGTGVNQPLGVMVPSDFGISTGRNVTTTASAAIKPDDLWNCVYNLKAQYRRGARWLFSRQALQMIRKLKDGTGGYVWNAGLASGNPDTVCGLPYDESEYMPSTFTTGLYIGLLCNWQYYWIVDALDMQVQVLTELYAMTNQNAYVARKETDAAPIQENGFSRLILG